MQSFRVVTILSKYDLVAACCTSQQNDEFCSTIDTTSYKRIDIVGGWGASSTSEQLYEFETACFHMLNVHWFVEKKKPSDDVGYFPAGRKSALKFAKNASAMPANSLLANASLGGHPASWRGTGCPVSHKLAGIARHRYRFLSFTLAAVWHLNLNAPNFWKFHTYANRCSRYAQYQPNKPSNCCE